MCSTIALKSVSSTTPLMITGFWCFRWWVAKAATCSSTSRSWSFRDSSQPGSIQRESWRWWTSWEPVNFIGWTSWTCGSRVLALAISKPYIYLKQVSNLIKCVLNKILYQSSSAVFTPVELGRQSYKCLKLWYFAGIRTQLTALLFAIGFAVAQTFHLFE